MTKEAKARAYKWHRQNKLGAAEALRLASLDVAEGRERWPRESGLASYQNKPGKDGGRWIEDTGAAGLRFVGFADEIAKAAGAWRSIDHSGYYTDSDGFGEVIRGAVFQLPAASDGRSRFVPGYREGNDSRRDGWTDTTTGRDSGAAVVYLDDVRLGDPGNGDSYERNAREDAWSTGIANTADSHAERQAEDRREYSDAWSAGRAAGESLAEALEARRAFLALRKESKAQLPLFGDIETPESCKALARELGRLAKQWRKGKAKAAEALDSYSHAWQSDLRATFLESFEDASQESAVVS